MHIKIHGIIAACVATRSIVVHGGAVETRISGILEGELQILHRPNREVRNIPGASRVAIGTAGRHTIQQGVDSPLGIEPTECGRIAIAEMVISGIIAAGSRQKAAGSKRSTLTCRGRLFNLNSEV